MLRQLIDGIRANDRESWFLVWMAGLFVVGIVFNLIVGGAA